MFRREISVQRQRIKHIWLSSASRLTKAAFWILQIQWSFLDYPSSQDCVHQGAQWSQRMSVKNVIFVRWIQGAVSTCLCVCYSGTSDWKSLCCHILICQPYIFLLGFLQVDNLFCHWQFYVQTLIIWVSFLCACAKQGWRQAMKDLWFFPKRSDILSFEWKGVSKDV